jgi:HigB_toxin, RelE-like toxic component of a toxin-antitoxin system
MPLASIWQSRRSTARYIKILFMRVIAKRTLREFWESTPKYADAEDPLRSWYREAKQAIWLTPADIKEQYRNASILKIIGLYSISQAINID